MRDRDRARERAKERNQSRHTLKMFDSHKGKRNGGNIDPREHILTKF